MVVAMIMLLGVGTSMGRWGPGFGKGLNRLHYCINQIEISSDTRETIDDLMEQYRENMDEHRSSMQSAEDIYFDVLTATELDEVALYEAENTILSLKQELSQLTFDLMRSIRELLTAEEVETLAECGESELETSENVRSRLRSLLQR